MKTALGEEGDRIKRMVKVESASFNHNLACSFTANQTYG